MECVANAPTLPTHLSHTLVIFFFDQQCTCNIMLTDTMKNAVYSILYQEEMRKIKII